MVITCKVCDQPSNYIGVVDPSKNVLNRKCSFPLATLEDLKYYKCTNCGFLHTPFFDSWDQSAFEKYIYNSEYIIVDPEYTYIRPKRTADWFVQNAQFPTSINKSVITKILDYGAGSAVFEQVLRREYGFTEVRSWDPFWKNVDYSWAPDERFDVITAFEVFEHTTTPVQTLFAMSRWLEPERGVILISTMTTEALESQDDLTHWYIAPRNGHVCMHSNTSLDVLFAQIGMSVIHYGNEMHYAFFNKGVLM